MKLFKTIWPYFLPFLVYIAAIALLFQITACGTTGGTTIQEVYLDPPEEPPFETEKDYSAFLQELTLEKSLSIVIIKCETPFEGGTRITGGTGTYLVGNKLLTAWHVIKNCNLEKGIDFVQNGVIIGQGFSISREGDFDLGFVLNVTLDIPPQEIMFDSIHFLGDFIVCLGHPALTPNLQTTWGYISSVREIPFNNDKYGWKNAYFGSYLATGGSSGAPIFDSTGNLVGIHVGRFGDEFEFKVWLGFNRVFGDSQ